MRWQRDTSGRPLLLALTLLVWPGTANAAKIACVGDSITYGHGLSARSSESYPAVLQELLGSAHVVENFGVSGATLLKSGDKPYWNEPRYADSTAFAPDVVLLMLGTNDAKPQNWANSGSFSSDYQALIEHYRALGAVVYLATPAHVFEPGAFDIPPSVVENQVVPLVKQIALSEQAPLVDVFQATSDSSALFPDTVHPDAAGARLLAETFAAALVLHNFDSPGDLGSGGAANSAGGAGGGSEAGTGGTEPGTGGAAVATGGAAGPSGDGGTTATGGTTAAGGTISAGSGSESNTETGGAAAIGGAGNGGTAGTGGAAAVASGGSTDAGATNGDGPTPNSAAGCQLSVRDRPAWQGITGGLMVLWGLSRLRRRRWSTSPGQVH